MSLEKEEAETDDALSDSFSFQDAVDGSELDMNDQGFGHFNDGRREDLKMAAELGKQLLKEKQELVERLQASQQELEKCQAELQEWQEFAGEAGSWSCPLSASAAKGLIADMKNTIQTYVRECSDKSSKILQLEFKCTELESTVASNNEEIAHLSKQTADVQKLKDRLATAEFQGSRLPQLEKEFQEAKRDCGKWKDRVSILEADCQQYQEEISRLQADLEEEKSEVRRLKRSMNGSTPRHESTTPRAIMDEETCKKSLQSAMQKIEDLNYEIASLKAAARAGEASASERSFYEETESENEFVNFDDAPKALDFDEPKPEGPKVELFSSSLNETKTETTSLGQGLSSSSNAVEEASFITLNLNLRKELENVQNLCNIYMKDNEHLREELAQEQFRRKEQDEISRFLEDLNLKLMKKLNNDPSEPETPQQQSKSQPNPQTDEDDEEMDLQEDQDGLQSLLKNVSDGIPSPLDVEVLALFSNAYNAVECNRTRLRIAELILECFFVLTLASIIMENPKLKNEHLDHQGIQSLVLKSKSTGVPFYEYHSWLRAQLRELPLAFEGDEETDDTTTISMQELHTLVMGLESNQNSKQKGVRKRDRLAALFSSPKKEVNGTSSDAGSSCGEGGGSSHSRDLCIRLIQINMDITEKLKKSVKRRKALELALEVEKLEKEEAMQHSRAVKDVCDLLSRQLAEREKQHERGNMRGLAVAAEEDGGAGGSGDERGSAGDVGQGGEESLS